MELTPTWKRSEMPPIPADQPRAPVPVSRPYLMQWTGHIIACPHCQSSDVFKRSTRGAANVLVEWKCHECRRMFKVPRGTGDHSVAVGAGAG